MRKFLIGYLLRELATILGALIAGGVTWSFCAALLPKPIAGVLSVISCIVVGKKIYQFRWWDLLSYSAAQRREADLALDARIAEENQEKEE